MIGELMGMFKKIVNMSLEQKKNRLVEIRVAQILREKYNGIDAIPPQDEIETIAILETILPLRGVEDVVIIMNKITSLREEINAEAESRLKK
jgi:hypothetical protein